MAKGTDMTESDLMGASPADAWTEDPFDVMGLTADESTMENAAGVMELAELIGAAGLDNQEVAVLALHGLLQWEHVEIAATGIVKYSTSKHTFGRALKKLRTAAERMEEDNKMADKFSVRCQISLTWEGVHAEDRQQAKETVEAMMAKFFSGSGAPPGWAEGVCLNQDDIVVAVTDVRGPSKPRRPRMANQGYPEGSPVAMRVAVEGVTT
jgi:hypothetical protein